MRNKVLFCATVDYHFKVFHLPILKWFKDQGWEVHIVANGKINLPFVDKKYHIPIQRSPFHKDNVTAYRELKLIIKKNNYQFIHCHTPMGGVLTRLAAKESRKKGSKVFYTAHGFHFCKGAPIMNWLIYYPIEKFLSPLTDCLITINEEDYHLAISHRFMAKEVEHVHGVGVDTEKFKPISADEKQRYRKQYGYKENNFLLFYAAEFNENKNQQLLIKVMSLIKERIPNCKLLLAGEGHLMESCKKLAEDLDVSGMVEFLGYRNDIEMLLPICDVAVASSIREGLPVNIMEAMACGLPIVATENRGHVELVRENQNGFIIPTNSIETFSSKLIQINSSIEMIKTFGEESKKIIASYNLRSVLKEISAIYSKYMIAEKIDNSLLTYRIKG